MNPSIVSTSPKRADIDIAVTASIVINFSKGTGYFPLKISTVNSNTVYLQSLDGLTKVACTITTDSYSITLKPTASLNSETQYKVDVIGEAGGITDTAGTPMMGMYSFFFTTGTSVTAVPTLLTPTTGQILYQIPTLTWENTGADKYEIQMSKNDRLFTTVYVQLESVTNSIVPDLTIHDIYYWRIRSVSSGITSSWSDPWYFKYAEAVTPTPDPGTTPDTLPKIVSTNPANMALNVPISSQYIEIVFDKPIVESSLTIKVTSENEASMSKEYISIPSVRSNTIVTGKSAYDIAVENGFAGTEEEWLESLALDGGEFSFDPSTGILSLEVTE